MDPSTTKKRPKPIIAILAVAIPLAAIALAAAVTTSRSDDGAATATTIAQAGDPGATAPSGGSGSKDGPGATTTAPGAGKATTTTTKKAAEHPAEVPSDPSAAGPEGERASVTYPQPTVPAAGCSHPGGTAVITLGSKPSPSCLELRADQPVIVRNRTGKEISFIAISINEVVAPGSEIRLGTAGSAFGDGRSTFWSPGNPQLSGIAIVG